MRVFIKTFGCKVNYADTEELAADLAKHGHHCSFLPGILDEANKPDVVVINTCAVTANSTKKARQYARRCIRTIPGAQLIVTGCGAREESIADNFASLGATVVDDIGAVAEELGKDDTPVSPPREVRTRRFIKIQDGCNSFCTYCIIPYVRSLSSKPTLEVMNEIGEALEEKAPEIVLCGINLGLYRDDKKGIGLVQLLRQALENIPKWSRLRLSSVEPEHVIDDLLELFLHPRLCPHLHLPLQSGSDTVLTAMGRKYNRDAYRDVVAKFRAMYPHGAVTTDVMVGFPGETDEGFAATCEIVRDCGFERIHVFRYSERPHTAASKMRTLAGNIVYQRKNELLGLSQQVAGQSLRRFVGALTTVAVEENGCGYGEAYQRVCLEQTTHKGKLTPVELGKVENGVFKGTLAYKHP